MTVRKMELLEAKRVSTHMPLARHDPTAPVTLPVAMEFLLTCLLRGMTLPCMVVASMSSFYSHASCEA